MQLEEELIGQYRDELIDNLVHGQHTEEEEAAQEAPQVKQLSGSRIISPHKVPELLKGTWRMYCRPDGDDGYSYGLIVTSVQQSKEGAANSTTASSTANVFELLSTTDFVFAFVTT